MSNTTDRSMALVDASLNRAGKLEIITAKVSAGMTLVPL